MTEPPARPAEGAYSGAGFWIRAVARLIDVGFGLSLGIFGAVLAMFVLAIFQVVGIVSPGWEQRVDDTSVAALGLSLLGGILYHSFCEGIHGATLGKLICRLRVLRQDGGLNNMRGAVIRSLGFYIDILFAGFIGFIAMQRSPLRQRLGDVGGKTIVIKTKNLPATDPRTSMHFLAGFFLGAACWILMLTLGFVLDGI